MHARASSKVLRFAQPTIKCKRASVVAACPAWAQPSSSPMGASQDGTDRHQHDDVAAQTLFAYTRFFQASVNVCLQVASIRTCFCRNFRHVAAICFVDDDVEAYGWQSVLVAGGGHVRTCTVHSKTIFTQQCTTNLFVCACPFVWVGR